MPNWSQLVKEIGQSGSSFDILRRVNINELTAYTGRNVICYYSGWLQKPELGTAVGVKRYRQERTDDNNQRLDVEKGS